MATTKIAAPQALTPAYNPVKYIYDSTNKNELGFKYIFDVYDTVLITKIAEYRVLPEFSTGYGEIDLSKFLQSKVSYDSNLTITASYNPANSYFQYDVKIGEEYITNFPYTASLTNNSGNVKITVSHTFIVGDQVLITQDDLGVANPQLEGLFTVTAVTGTTDFTVNSLWSEVTNATINGTASYADNRKTITRDIATVSNQFVFNGAMSFTDFINWDRNEYILSANTDKFFTNCPDEFYMTDTSDAFFHIGNNATITGFVYYQNDAGDTFKKAITNSELMTGVAVGANNYGTLTLVSGTPILLKDDTEYYDVWYTNSAGNQWSQKYRFVIDRRCKIEDFEVLFMDRMGSYLPFAFQLRAKETGDIQRQSFNKNITGFTSALEWNYLSYEFGNHAFDIKVGKMYEISTNWMTQEMAVYFEELLTSPITYLKISGQYVACTIQDSSFEVERQKNKKLIRKTITVKLANNNVVNV